MVAKKKVGVNIDHPCKDKLIWNLSKNSLDRDIRFTKLIKNGTNALMDHQRCWLWERERTRFFRDKNFSKQIEAHKVRLKENFTPLDSSDVRQIIESPLISKRKEENKLTNIFFPYFCEHWPQKPYLSIAFQTRKKFPAAIEVTNHLHFKHPFKERLYTFQPNPLFDQNTAYYKLGVMKAGYIDEPPYESIELNLQIGTNWTQERFVEIMKYNSKQILEKIDEERKLYENKGYKFAPKLKRKPIRTYKSLLKKLGHFRLSESVGLDYLEITKKYPEKKKNPKYFAYEDEAFKAAIREIRKFLKSSSSADR